MIFGDGIHAYYYPKPGGAGGLVPRGGPPDAPAVAAQMRELGIATIVAHDAPDPSGWMTPARERAFADAGIAVAAGCGSLGPVDGRWQLWAAAMVRCLDRGWRVMPDWEESWCKSIGKASARRVVEYVCARAADAPTRCVSNPWWAPLYRILPDGSHEGTHPNAPYLEFGVLTPTELAPQDYGAPVDGQSERMLAWSRHPSQYEAIARGAGRAPWAIAPSVQAYNRSLNDHVRMFLRERKVFLWQWTELDAACLRALRVVVALRGHGFTGPTAVRDFQALAGLTPDDIVGPKTLAALGL